MSSSLLPDSSRRRRRRGIVLAVLALAGALWGGNSWWVSSRLKAARTALENQDLDRASEYFDVYLSHRPRDREARLLAARTARRRDDAEEMERHLSRCEEQQGVSDASALERALLRAQRGELRSLEGDVRGLVEAGHPERVLILEALARGYMNAYRMAQALDALDLLLDLDPNHVAALLLRGRVWESQRNDDEAAADYTRAVERAPGLADARLRLADVLARLGRLREAVAHYEFLRGRPPVHSSALIGLARCRHDLREIETAERLLDGLLAEEPEHRGALIEWGRVVTRAGRAAEAEARLQKAAASAPYDRESWLALALCLTAQGKAEEALRCQARVRAIEADLMRFTILRDSLAEDETRQTEKRSEIGSLLLRLGREAEALRWLTSALERDPSHTPTHRILADHYERTHRSADAARHRLAAQRGMP